MLLRRSIILLLLIFPSAELSFAQETSEDKVNKQTSYDQLIKIQTQLNEFEFYRELNYMRMDLNLNNDPNTIWMWTKLALLNNGKPDKYSGESPVNMLEPLHQQFLENSKFNPVRYVLGMAQTAAVGYLAYRHIKKYGLFR